MTKKQKFYTFCHKWRTLISLISCITAIIIIYSIQVILPNGKIVQPTWHWYIALAYLFIAGFVYCIVDDTQPQNNDIENLANTLVENTVTPSDEDVELAKSIINKHKIQQFQWTDNKVIEFVNWYVKLHKLPFSYTLENQTIIDSFKHGDYFGDWHENDEPSKIKATNEKDQLWEKFHFGDGLGHELIDRDNFDKLYDYIKKHNI